MGKEAIISSPRLNSYGTRVLTEGIDTEQYGKNPVLLYMHRRYNRDDKPIGRIENLRVEGDIMYGTPVFDEDTEEERIIAKKWERGTLRMLSAGLDILEWSEDPVLLVQGQTRPTITRSKLVEVSVVDIGANDDALQLYSGGKLLKLSQGEESVDLPLLKESEETPGDAGATDNNKQTTSNKMEKILLKLGLLATATEDEAVAAIEGLQRENEAVRLSRITDAVEAAIRERRITDDKKDHFINLGKAVGFDQLQATLKCMTPAQKPTEIIGHQRQTPSVDLKWENMSAQQRAELRESDRAEYVRLYKEYYHVEPEIQ